MRRRTRSDGESKQRTMTVQDNTRRVSADGLPWREIEETKRFITDLFAGPAPDRPGMVMHLPAVGDAPAPPADPAPGPKPGLKLTPPA